MLSLCAHLWFGRAAARRQPPATPATASADPAPALDGAAPHSDATAETVLARYIEVTGGEAAHRAITSMKASGTMDIPAAKISAPISVHWTAKGEMLVEVDIPGLGQQVQGGDGTTYWEMSPMSGARIVEGDERTRMIRDLNPLTDVEWKKFYKEAKLTGQENVDGAGAHVVEMIDNMGEKETRYYSIETGYLVSKKETAITQQGKFQTTTSYQDYRKNGNFVEAHKIVIKAANAEQVLTLGEVLYNHPIDSSVFKLPADIKALVP